MEERLKNIVFISICEACLLYYRENGNMSNFNYWCQYNRNYIVGNLANSQVPKDIIKIEFYIIDYLHKIYGFYDDETLILIYEFFMKKKWDDLYELAKYTLYIQDNNKLN